MTEMTAGSKAAADVAALLRARNSLLWIVTREEARVERFLVEACASANYEPRMWDCATGVSDLAGRPVDASMTDPADALRAIRSAQSRQAWILRDLTDRWLGDPGVKRLLRTLARQLPQAPRDQARSVIVLSPSSEVPPELAGHAIVIEWPLPDRAEIAGVLDARIEALPEELRATAAPNGVRDAAIDAAVGLTEEEAKACYAKSLVATKKIEPSVIASEKKKVIAREKVLEWFDPLPGGLDSVGGLDVLKSWLTARRAAFTARARAYGLPAPKGAMLVGVPGCGKSLTAKAIATAWGMPLLRLDLGALKSKWVGESEGNIRKALKVAETVSPCVVWLDEIEKALGGASQGAADGGVSSDALGVILSWMQDRVGSTFVIATANDVSALPPELLRKGRFDEMFFVDLPNRTERMAILAAALKAHGRDVAKIEAEPASIADATQDFTGAEITALVPEALFVAFADGEREIRGSDLVAAARATVPLAKTASEKITKLREWAKGRARPASTPESKASGKGGALDL
jgi:SpoVK/Ycf46/Vps4 family AAA+-type ATPase